MSDTVDEDDEGRVNVEDMETEDALRVLLNVDLRDLEKDSD
jgi:hypothetical protein